MNDSDPSQPSSPDIQPARLQLRNVMDPHSPEAAHYTPVERVAAQVIRMVETTLTNNEDVGDEDEVIFERKPDSPQNFLDPSLIIFRSSDDSLGVRDYEIELSNPDGVEILLAASLYVEDMPVLDPSEPDGGEKIVSHVALNYSFERTTVRELDSRDPDPDPRFLAKFQNTLARIEELEDSFQKEGY